MRRIVRLVCTSPGCDYASIPARHPLANPAMCPRCLRKTLGSEIWAVEHHYVTPSPPLASVLDAIRDAFAAEGLAF